MRSKNSRSLSRKPDAPIILIPRLRATRGTPRGMWSRRDNADYPAANGTIREEQGDPYASFASDGSGGWFISADSPRVFTGEVTFETRCAMAEWGAEPGYNRNLFVISDNDDDQVALINNSKSGFFKTAMSIGATGQRHHS